jgi:pyruvate dehydrogenase E1 component alpha subunit
MQTSPTAQASPGRAGLAGADRAPLPELPAAAPATDADLRELYRLMTAVRQLDLAAVAWQRQGILPAYAPELGQEAAQVASALALDLSRDFAFPTYRELGVARAAGVDMVEYMSTHLAAWHGGLWDAAATHVAPIQAVVAGSVLHAVGWAHGQTLQARAASAQSSHEAGGAGTDGLGVAITYLGDGASSQGDVHEAMNFAGVFKAPVVFFVQNNGWAISVPTERQVAGGSVAARGAGYGIPALQVDGNDAAAVLEATRRAVAHARAGRGPVIVEAMTYRRGPHATSDDPGRYRTLDEERTDGGADPLLRLRERLHGQGIADEAELEAADAAGAAEAESVREGILALGPRPGAEMFDLVFTEPTDELLQQKAAWREESEHA